MRRLVSIAAVLSLILGGSAMRVLGGAPVATPLPAAEATAALPATGQSMAVGDRADGSARRTAVDGVSGIVSVARLPDDAALLCVADLVAAWGALAAIDERGPRVAAGLAEYDRRGLDHRDWVADYAWNGGFLGWSRRMLPQPGPDFTYDDNGVPMTRYEGVLNYNPVTAAQVALVHHGLYLSGLQSADSFLALADWLVGWSQDDGGLPYVFEWSHHLGTSLQAPWYSGMAQGHMLSVMARAHDLTGDDIYLAAGEAALEFMLAPMSAGGTTDTLGDLAPCLDHVPIYEEYLVEPGAYTLNGFMFALLGLADWVGLGEAIDAAGGSFSVAAAALAEGLGTLRTILPLYDLGGMTTYDLGHLTWDADPFAPAHYHSIHIGELDALAQISGDVVLAETARRWAGYVDDLDPTDALPPGPASPEVTPGS